MTWFEKLTGFAETSGDDVRSKLRLDGTRLTSVVNGRTVNAGEFMTPALFQLRQSGEIPNSPKAIRVSEVVADVQALHQDPANADAVFQVASQFNCLEMAAPQVIPEDGVGIYQNDWTQGPACCLCAGGGTIYRNYFVDVGGRTGQSADNQINCLSAIERHFQNANASPLRMENGYCFPSEQGLSEIQQQLSGATESEASEIGGKLMVGVQSNSEVTIGDSGHCVTQVFCSALPLSYSDIPADQWNQFPRLILDAAYESTFYVAMKNMAENGCSRLYLTLVGGGVFGNRLEWILSAIDRSLKLFSGAPLDVRIVSYGSSKPEVAALVRQHNAA